MTTKQGETFLRFERTAPKKWFVSDDRFGGLTMGPFPSRKRAREFALWEPRQPSN